MNVRNHPNAGTATRAVPCKGPPLFLPRDISASAFARLVEKHTGISAKTVRDEGQFFVYGPAMKAEVDERGGGQAVGSPHGFHRNSTVIPPFPTFCHHPRWNSWMVAFLRLSLHRKLFFF